MQTKNRPLLVVTDAATNITIPAKKNTVIVTGIDRLFPAIFELKPDGIVLDYDYLGNDIEKTLRRIRSNPFYSKLKIYCYKSRSHTKVDSLLKVLGVQYFLYATDVKPKTSSTLNIFSHILKGAVTNKLAEAV